MSYKRVSPQPVVEGGTGAQTLTGVLIGSGTSAISGNAITQYDVLVGGASNAISSVAPSSTSGVPLVSGGSSSNPSFGTAVVAGGGTGLSSVTAYAPLVGGSTSTANLAQVTSGLNTAGYVLTANGSGAPTFQAASVPSLSVTSINFSNTPYSVLSSDQFIAVDSTSGAITVKLPNSTTTGRVIYIKDQTGTATGANAMTITTVGGSVTIDGSTSVSINTAYQSMSVIFDGTNYEIF